MRHRTKKTRSYSNRLRRARTERELSLSDVAILVGRDPSTVSRYEEGVYPVPEHVYRVLAKEWCMSVDWLMGLDRPDRGLSAALAGASS